MTTLKVTVGTSKMPHTSEFFATCKAIDHFYYALLFATDPAYTGVSDRWALWASMGFSNAIRDAPTCAAESDRMTRSVFSDGKLMVITASSARADLLGTLADLLSGEGIPERVDAGLRGPVSASLIEVGATAHEVAQFMEVLDRGVEALTYRDITSLEVTLDDSVSVGAGA